MTVEQRGDINVLYSNFGLELCIKSFTQIITFLCCHKDLFIEAINIEAYVKHMLHVVNKLFR